MVEAGHRCAIPQCRHIEVDIHHIIPWEECQKHEYENLIALCPNCHRRADNGKIDRKSLRIYKANLRFIHDKFSQLELDILFELAKKQPGEQIQFPNFMRILIRRIEEAAYVAVEEKGTFFRVNDMAMGPDNVRLTEKGRAFLSELGVHDLVANEPE